MADAGPVTVVLVGAESVAEPDLEAVPGVRVLARTGDPRRGPRLVGCARPQVVLAGLGRDRDAVLAVVPELAARVLVVAGRRSDAASRAADPAADVLAAVRAGAAGYLAATVDVDALADALLRTARGESVFSAGLAEVVLDEVGRPTGPAPRLTPRETEVLRLVVEGLTSRQVASRLVVSPRTVENHVQRVLRRLGLPNRAALVRHAVEKGLA
jgi:DNA-binding NarL/FixJ family response regulator